MNRLFAISDIHGCFDTFYELVTKRIGLTRSDRLILLGDYIDRGDKSREVIDFITDLVSTGYDVVPLAGNHEAMLLDSFRDYSMLPLWFMNSGETTLDSFRIDDICKIDSRYIEFFTSLSYYHTWKDFVFVHAGFNDNAIDPFGDINGMIWECHTGYEHPELRNRTIIHGHRPKTVDHVLGRIASGSRVIPIDTGCVYGEETGYGFLSALRVDTMELIPVAKI